MTSFPTELFIDGERRTARNGASIPQVNPANEEQFCQVAAAGLEELNAAVEGAHRTWKTEWRDLSPRKRTDLLFALTHLIRQNSETLAQLECRNVGKPISDARDEVELGARVFEYYAGAIGKFFGQTIPVGRGGFDFTFRQPMGVVAGLLPPKFPFPHRRLETTPSPPAGKKRR